MTNFAVETIQPMQLTCCKRLANMYVLSPFVWEENGAFRLLLRAVPKRDDEPRLKMAEIWYGESEDGLTFRMDEGPAVFPGPELEDLDGCEDPTVIVRDGKTHVWYTGWNQKDETGRLLYAAGPDPRSLVKAGVSLASTSALTNPKEATVVQDSQGDWRLFFEFARDGASRIGIADAKNIGGPWSAGESALLRREDHWDNWHLSTGPIIDADKDRPIMFYNGATKDAHWRIGWAGFDKTFGEVRERSDQPLITPPKAEGDATDIAFASSAVERGDQVWLYYSISDQDIMRATLKRA